MEITIRYQKRLKSSAFGRALDVGPGMSGLSLHRESLIALLGPVLVWPIIVVTRTDYTKYAQPRLLTLMKTENLLEHGEDHPHGDESLKTGSEICLTATAILEWEIG